MIPVPLHDDQDDPAPPHPAPLDYFAPRDPQRVADRSVTASALILLFSWAPYLCGVVNAVTAGSAWYVPAIASVHVNASVVFLVIGLGMALASLIRFVRARHWPGATFAGAVVLMQVTVAGCIGLA